MLSTHFSPWPSFTSQEADAVSRVLLSNKVNYWTGTECLEFEKEFSDWVGCKYAISLSNGTVALELALKALQIGEGDEVVTTPRSFLATASSIVNVNAKPVFADVDLNSQAITAESIEAVITSRTKAVIVVHLAGMPAEMDAIMALSKKFGFKVIEDCAQAHGALYRGKSVGTIGDVGVWSFCQDKIMTTGGEGGMVTTNDSSLWSSIWSYKDHGKSYTAVHKKTDSQGFRWLHESFGTNARMTEMQAVIGRIQISRMEEWSRKRRENAQAIDDSVLGLNVVRSVVIPEYIKHAEYKHYLFVREEYLAEGWCRDKIIQEITALGVPAYQGSCPELYLEKAFDDLGCRPREPLKNAEQLGRTSLMFLVHPTLTQVEIEKTCSVISKVLLRAQR